MSDELETITIDELSEATSLLETDEFILENASHINKKILPGTVKEYMTDGLQEELNTTQMQAVNSGINSQKVVGLNELLSKTIAEIDDTRATTGNAFSASKTLHVPTVVISANAAASKTINAYYQNNGASVKVLLINGHSGATFKINGKTVYANKDGVAVAVPSHTINSVNWFVQAYTTLELIYLSSLDDGNGGWLIVGNPVVLSGGTTTGRYEVRANGFIKQWVINIQSEANNTYYVTLPVSFAGADFLAVACVTTNQNTTALDIDGRGYISCKAYSLNQVHIKTYQFGDTSSNYGLASKKYTLLCEGY